MKEEERRAGRDGVGRESEESQTSDKPCLNTLGVIDSRNHECRAWFLFDRCRTSPVLASSRSTVVSTP